MSEKRFYIDWDDRREESPDGDALRVIAEKVVGCALNENEIDRAVNIGIALVTDEEIAGINLTYRGIGMPTDVLSFPIIDYDISSETHTGDVDPETGALILGDIVISVERAHAQAAEYGHSFSREFAFLVAHGMLHLLGFDHVEPEEEREMLQIQESILQKLAYSREAK